MNAPDTKPFDVGAWLINSPWFFAAMFSGIGLLLLVAFSPKYDLRQADIEQNYQARSLAKTQEDAKARQAAQPQSFESKEPDQIVAVQYSTPDNKMIGLLPLFMVLALILAISLVVLARQYLAQSAHSSGDSFHDAASEVFDA